MTRSKDDFPQRLNEADAMFLRLSNPDEVPYAPVGVTVHERAFDDDEVMAYLQEVQSRLLPASRRRIVTDRLSPALPRWVDVPGFDPAEQYVTLPPPGDGSMRAILDFAAQWARMPMPLDRPPWRAVYFENVTVDGVPGRMVSVSQTHHAVIDGAGATRLAEQFLQFAPDAPLPAMPPPVPPDTSTAWERWKEGWALEGVKAAELLRNTKARLKWAASDPRAGARRARELAGALRRMTSHQSQVPHSWVLRRRSDAMRFDILPVDITALKTGARAVGGTVNDGFMAAISVALHQYHHDRGVVVHELRTAMAINTRTEKQGHAGNEVIGVMLGLPLCEDAATAVKACGEVSRAHRDDRDVLWVIDRLRAMANRAPRRLVVAASKKTLTGVDLQISNVPGISRRMWVGGVETLRGTAFNIGGPSALSLILQGGSPTGHLGMETDPAAIHDPEHLVERLAEGFAAVAALAG